VFVWIIALKIVGWKKDKNSSHSKKLLEYSFSEYYCKFPHHGIIEYYKEDDAKSTNHPFSIF